ncbi:viable flagellar protein number 3 [Achlya hypogyna]|uniref:Viable flagellar protein number 3 n=1 Tax=Achlya hypogyna TaxID=1202772 RepID=A0A1V9ZDN1_ACHHY|nr:viable flagellar protein number 3 [Achlya hypogyna]
MSSEGKSMEATGTMCFHGVEYSVEIWVQRDELHVQVEEESLKATPDIDRWGGHFPAAYIEELTKKTGNFKRFYTFVNMLVSALNHKSDSVFIDLLTYSDLELYRKRKLGKSMTDTGASTPHANNKRYLILTYAVEFDRVHYPLPLNSIDHASPELLQKTILRLKQALAEAKVDGGYPDKQLAALQDENASLRVQIKQLQSTRDGDATEAELQGAARELKELMARYQQLRKDSSKEINELKAQIEALESQQSRVDVEAIDQKYAQRIRQLEKEMERARTDHKRLVMQLERQVDNERTKLGVAETELHELQLKNRELMRQLAVARTKSTPRDRPAPPPPPVLSGPRNTRTSTPTRRPLSRPSSGHESDGEPPLRYADRPPRTTYKRFDPTAYHLERQAKLRARSQSPQPPTRASSASRLPANGYSSDSSAGYQSGGSTSSRRPRPRSRQGSFEHQRDATARLASPRYPTSKKASPAPTSRRSPSPTVPRKAPTKSQTAKPFTKAKTTATPVVKALPAFDDDSDSDLGPSSFTDIDNRLNALQQFLKDAKHGVKGGQ